MKVPPEIMELLNDDSSSDMSAKEIMRQWEQRGKNPLSAPTTSPRNQGGTASRKDQRNAPQITPADNNPQPHSGEASVRHVGPGGQAAGPAPCKPQNSPPQQYDMGTPNPPFGRNPQESAESHRTASPHRQSYRSPGYQKQTQIGTAGAT